MLSNNKPILSEIDYNELIINLRQSEASRKIDVLNNVFLYRVDCSHHDIYHLLIELLLERYKKLTIFELEQFELLIIDLLKRNAGEIEKIADSNMKSDIETENRTKFDARRHVLQLALKLIVTHPEYEFFNDIGYLYHHYEGKPKRIIYHKYKYHHSFFYAALNLCRDNLDPLESAYWMSIFNLFYFNEDTPYQTLDQTLGYLITNNFQTMIEKTITPSLLLTHHDIRFYLVIMDMSDENSVILPKNKDIILCIFKYFMELSQVEYVEGLINYRYPPSEFFRQKNLPTLFQPATIGHKKYCIRLEKSLKNIFLILLHQLKLAELVPMHFETFSITYIFPQVLK